MKFVVRWLFRLLVLTLVLALALVLLKDVLLEEYLEGRLQRATGLEVRIGRLETGLFTPLLTFEDLRLYNPPEFGGAPFLVAPEVHVVYDRAALARGVVHLRLLRVHVAELVVVEDGRGGQNLRALGARWLTPGGPAGRAPFRFGGIDTVNLTLDRVRRVNLLRPDRNLALDPGIRQQVFQSLRASNDLAWALAQLAARPGLAAALAPPAPTNAPPSRPVSPAR